MNWGRRTATIAVYFRNANFYCLGFLSCDSIEAIRDRVATLESEVEDPAAFKSLYTFTFGFANVDRHDSKTLGKLFTVPTFPLPYT